MKFSSARFWAVSRRRFRSLTLKDIPLEFFSLFWSPNHLNKPARTASFSPYSIISLAVRKARGSSLSTSSLKSNSGSSELYSRSFSCLPLARCRVPLKLESKDIRKAVSLFLSRTSATFTGFSPWRTRAIAWRSWLFTSLHPVLLLRAPRQLSNVSHRTWTRRQRCL